ncbi:hypothetical protein M3J09_011804 [Ascochyta lentis]
MRSNFSIWVAVSLWHLLAVSHAQTNNFGSLPSCAQNCMEDTFRDTMCHPLLSSDLSCACHNTALLEKVRVCTTVSCGRKDELTALNITFKVCSDKPIPDKSKSYRLIILAFYTLAVIAMAAQWIVRFTVGRLQWLDDGNMVMVLALDTVLFATCYKMSFTGLGLDMWNVPFSGITTTLLVRCCS